MKRLPFVTWVNYARQVCWAILCPLCNFSITSRGLAFLGLTRHCSPTLSLAQAKSATGKAALHSSAITCA